MIIDLYKFISEEKAYWSELEEIIEKIEKQTLERMDIHEIKRFHYLYQRASADLAKVSGFSSEADIKGYLESLVGRAYSETHEIRNKNYGFSFTKWFFKTFPQTFRRHIKAFWISLAITILGMSFGAMAICIDDEAKDIIIGFSHLKGDPNQRVEYEEGISPESDRMKGTKSRFSAYLMTHNIRVSIFVFAMGLTWGIGTIITLFYNGVILGAISMDYCLAGQAKFLVGWLLPHGSVEIPAILLAGQAGFVLAGALIGWGTKMSFRMRMRKIAGDLATLMFGLAIMLVWAGFVESFLSQYHEPVIPYSAKIALGMAELVILILFFYMSGRSRSEINRG